MKLLCIFFLLPLSTLSQGYFNIEGLLFSKGEVALGGGPLISFGGMLKSPTGGGIIQVGGGGGVLMNGDNENYYPVFFELGYLNTEKKIFPHILGRVGYGFSTDGMDIGSGRAKEGLYLSMRAGLSAKVGIAHFIPFVGVAVIQKTDYNGYDPTASGLFHFGLSATFYRRKK